MYACVRIAGTGCKLKMKHSVFGLCPLIFWASHSVLITGGRILLCQSFGCNRGICTSVSNCTKWLSAAKCVQFALYLLLMKLNHRVRKHYISCKIDKKFEETSEVFLAS